jgi:uncharacterized phage protein (TIGR02218 family)
MGTIPYFFGTVGTITPTDTAFNMEVNGLKKALENPVIERYSLDCRAVLGDARCKFDLNTAGFRSSSTVVSSGNRYQFVRILGAVTAWWDYGIVEFTSGANDGLIMEVKSYVHSSGLWTLRRPMPYDIVAGDAFTATAGCNKTFAQCVSKFDNAVNFQGEPHIPTESRVKQIVGPLWGGWQNGFR